MKFAKYTFLIAGIYALVVLLPQYFLEEKVGLDSAPAITHQEFSYRFIGVAAAFQMVFIIISIDPQRYRLLVPASIAEKFSFVVAIAILSGRTAGPILIGAALDLVLGVMFLISWFTLASANDVKSVSEAVD